jgi:ADP-ribose pyrophosphatase
VNRPTNTNDTKTDQIIQHSEVCHDGFFKLKRHTIQYDKFDGSKSRVHKREVLVREPTVAILIYDQTEKTVLLTEQFRIGPLENDATPWVYELPAGIVEDGEDKKVAVEREVLEETGYRCNANELIGEFYLSPGGSNETTALFFAEQTLSASGLHGAMGENEDIRTHIVSIDTAVELMQKGNLSLITGLAIMWLKANKLRA